MNRQLISNEQKPKNSILMPASDIFQRKRTGLNAGTENKYLPVQQQKKNSAATLAESKFNQNFSNIPVSSNGSFPIQAKLKIGQPNDKYEQQADRVAEQVMRLSNTVTEVHPQPIADNRIQRQETAPTSGTAASSEEPEAERPLPSPDVSVENNEQLNSSLSTSPQLTQGLSLLDPTRFNLFISPLGPLASSGPLRPLSPSSSAQNLFNIPTALQPTTTPVATVPSQFSPFGFGFFRFRIVFQQPNLELSEGLRESEQRFSQFVNPPAPGIDTGKLIKGLISNFLTQTPLGQDILHGITRAVGSDSEDSASTSLNLDILPSPVLEGRLPGVMLNIEGRF